MERCARRSCAVLGGALQHVLRLAALIYLTPTLVRVPPPQSLRARQASSLRSLPLVSKATKTVDGQQLGLSEMHLTYIDKYLPSVANLSLLNNNIRLWRDLDCISWRWEKLLNLRELVLMGNPFEIARRFLTLELADQEPIAKISFDVSKSDDAAANAAGPIKPPSSTTFPFAMSPSFIDGGTTSAHMRAGSTSRPTSPPGSHDADFLENDADAPSSALLSVPAPPRSPPPSRPLHYFNNPSFNPPEVLLYPAPALKWRVCTCKLSTS
ncbi:hypothetical protein DFH07DRAFT_988975 [Mycena maculata]|uniref:Uncharacterized protein n=1 Tax=Mycena maculata TaxID=230809 RepID=A0AAD7HQ98_9AGAR|nr:hypothetical protein DFH07DRAFT_970712 [Mycena maculata]KAJ7734323.1 hypothetical protein DFH07DRAFT_988975 [Mycena maculata]